MSGSASIGWTLPFTSRSIRAMAISPGHIGNDAIEALPMAHRPTLSAGGRGVFYWGGLLFKPIPPGGAARGAQGGNPPPRVGARASGRGGDGRREGQGGEG